MKNHANSSLSQLIKLREELRGEKKRIEAELEPIEAELIKRLVQLNSAFMGGGVIPPAPELPLPSHVAMSPATRASTPAAISTGTAVPVSVAVLRRASSFQSNLQEEAKLWSRDIGDKIRSFAREHIEIFGPSSTRELFEAMEKERLVVPGKSPLNNLSAHLSRAEEFVNTPRGWDIKREREG